LEHRISVPSWSRGGDPSKTTESDGGKKNANSSPRKGAFLLPENLNAFDYLFS